MMSNSPIPRDETSPVSARKGSGRTRRLRYTQRAANEGARCLFNTSSFPWCILCCGMSERAPHCDLLMLKKANRVRDPSWLASPACAWDAKPRLGARAFVHVPDSFAFRSGRQGFALRRRRRSVRDETRSLLRRGIPAWKYARSVGVGKSKSVWCVGVGTRASDRTCTEREAYPCFAALACSRFVSASGACEDVTVAQMCGRTQRALRCAGGGSDWILAGGLLRTHALVHGCCCG